MSTVKVKKRIKKSMGEQIFDVANIIFMCLVSFTVLYPLWNMVVVSLSRIEDVSFMKVNLWPANPTLGSYKYIIGDTRFASAFFISVSRTVVGTIYHIAVIYLAAYSLTRVNMPFLKGITVIFVITMFFSGGLIPTYLLMKQIGLTNNFLIYVLPPAFSMFTVVIVRNYLFTIDAALEEAAVIDGASPLQVMYRIMLPLSKPVLATIALWAMVNQWNSWFDNMIYNNSSESLLTLQLLLRRMIQKPEEFAADTAAFAAFEQNVSINPETVKSAITILVILPIICVYPFLQKYFVKGIMLGSVKG